MAQVTRVLQTVKIASLKPHPMSVKLYGKPDKELAEDVAKRGIQQPPQVTRGNLVVDGNRRIEAWSATGATEVQVIVRNDLDDPEAAERAVILCNRYETQRKKTTSQIAAEAAELLRIETVFAERRRQATLRRGTVTAPVKSPENTDEKGTAAEIAGRGVGWSANTVKAAAEVMQAVESADPETAAELTKTLDEEGVKPALRKVREKRAAKNGEEVRVKDKLGNIVPGCLEVTFSDGDRQFTAAILSLGKVRENLSALREKPWGIRLTQQIESKVQAIADTLRNERPHCGCPWCFGSGRIKVDGSECQRCLGAGWITRAIYDQLDDATRALIPGS